MNEESTIFSKLIENIKHIKEIKKSVLDSFMREEIDKPNNSGANLNILILNTPCFGSGDITFAIKIANYVREWYGANVSIASTQIDKFKALGETKNLIGLVNRNNDRNNPQCRRFKALKFQHNLQQQDLIFVAPMQSDYDPNMTDIKYLIPYADIFNTFFFSEYNHPSDNKYFDFSTGIGKNKCGMLFTNPAKNTKITDKIKNPYAFVYIADSIENAEKCFISFIEMVSAKYQRKYQKFEIVVPPSILKILEDNESKIIKKVKKYYKNIICVTKDKEYYVLEGNPNDNLLIFRFDILPVPNQDFLSLVENSVRDILVTGDQSITDVLSCCVSKNIFYQIAPWKRNFGRNLAKYMPNQYIKSCKTSCGTLKAIKYNSNYNKFVKDWDFRTLAKPKMDAIIRYAKFSKNK